MTTAVKRFYVVESQSVSGTSKDAAVASLNCEDDNVDISDRFTNNMKDDNAEATVSDDIHETIENTATKTFQLLHRHHRHHYVK